MSDKKHFQLHCKWVEGNTGHKEASERCLKQKVWSLKSQNRKQSTKERKLWQHGDTQNGTFKFLHPSNLNFLSCPLRRNLISQAGEQQDLGFLVTSETGRSGKICELTCQLATFLSSISRRLLFLLSTHRNKRKSLNIYRQTVRD